MSPAGLRCKVDTAGVSNCSVSKEVFVGRPMGGQGQGFCNLGVEKRSCNHGMPGHRVR